MIKHLLLILIWGMNVLMLQHFLDFTSKLSLFIFLAGLMIWARFRKQFIISVIPPVMLLGMLIWFSTIQASNDREWRTDVSILPKIDINNEIVTIENLRNAIWDNPRTFTPNWETRKYDLNKLISLDLIVEPFKDSKLMAHTMLDFRFEDQGHIIVSVEARKEIHEEYSLVAGALQQFELIYVFGDEKDLLTLRALVRGSRLHLYPIKAEPEFIVTSFKDLAMSANALHTKPQFYRTLRDNCTSTLVEHIDRHYQQKIGLRAETIFPAKAGELLHKLGHMDTHLSYDQAYEVSRIDHIVRELRSEERDNLPEAAATDFLVSERDYRDVNFSSKLHARSSMAYANK
jgi:hypothetical protein